MYLDLDLIEDKFGYVYSVVGNQNKDLIHGRLTYTELPSSSSTMRPFKVGTKLIPSPPNVAKIIMELPGEQHYLIRKSDVVKHHSTLSAINNKNEIAYNICRTIKRNISDIEFGFTGSVLLGKESEDSDLDFILHCKPEKIEEVHDNLKNFGFLENLYTPDVEFIYQKYFSYEIMNKKDLIYSFEKRWKYFIFKGKQVSLFFVNPVMKKLRFDQIKKTGKFTVLIGTVQESYGCFYTPKIFNLKTVDQTFNVISWLFLFNGIFKNGDVLKIMGEIVLLNNRPFILLHPPCNLEFIK